MLGRMLVEDTYETIPPKDNQKLAALQEEEIEKLNQDIENNHFSLQVLSECMTWPYSASYKHQYLS